MSYTDGTPDLIDSRDLIERFDDIEADETADADERAIADAIRSLADEGIEDWQHGATLIHENHFEDYAKQLAEDVGAVDSTTNTNWPLMHIDWDAAAEHLKEDYTEVTFLDATYFVR